MRKLALLLIVALLALPASALADVRKGDRGEEVRYLQWLLFNTGWIFEEPDGAFGGHTEQAVKNYQNYKGYPQTGVADYELMKDLETDRAELDREIYGPDYYMPYDGDFTPPFTADNAPEYVAPAHCLTAVTPTLAWRDTCQRHMELLAREAELTRFDDAASIAEARDLWLEDIRSTYALWIQEAPAEQRLDILAAWTGWTAAFEAQGEAMLALWSDGPAVQRELTLMAREYALALCELRSGEPVTNSDIAIEESAEDAAEPFCMQWYEGATEYTAPCGEHAVLFEQEAAWTAQGASDYQVLNDMTIDWKHELLVLYDQWFEQCNESQAPAVERATDAYFAALARLGDAFAHDCGTTEIAQLRAAEFECARMCEMLNAAMASQ